MLHGLALRQASLRLLGGVSPQLCYKLYHRGELEGAKIAGTVRTARPASRPTWWPTATGRLRHASRWSESLREPSSRAAKRVALRLASYTFARSPERFRLPAQIHMVHKKMRVMLSDDGGRVAEQFGEHVD